MNTQNSASAVIVVVATLSALAQPAGDKAHRDPWYGFADGSWAVVLEKKTLKDKSAETKAKLLLVKYEQDVPQLARLPEVNGQFGEVKSTFANRPGGFPADSEIAGKKKETLQIGDVKIPCEVVEYEIENKEADFKARLTVWRNGDRKLPYREIPASAGNAPALLSDIVRAEYSYHYRGAAVKYVVEVVDFSKPLTIGDREITCVVEKITFQEAARDKSFKGEGMRWLSAEIPGQEARVHLKGTSNGVPLEVERTVVDFKASPQSK